MEIIPSTDPTLSSVPSSDLDPSNISEPTPPHKSVSPIDKKIRLLSGLVIGLVVLVCVVAISTAVYVLPTSDTFVKTITSVVPYPIAVVNMKPIAFSDFYKERAALENFYEANATPEEERMSDIDINTAIIETMIDREVIRQLSVRYAISLSQEKIDEVYTEAYSANGSEEDFLSEVEKMFGWDKEQFLNHVVIPVVLASQVEEAVSLDEELQTEAKTKIDEALNRIKAGEDFSAVATEVSEDPSASEGGDLGFLSVTQLPEEWMESIITNELNTPTEVIDLGRVYSLAVATDRVEGDEGTQFGVKVIIVYKTAMDEVVESFTASSKIWNFLKIWHW